MSEYIAFHSHKRYTWMERMDRETGEVVCRRVEHAPGAIRGALEGSARGTPVAIEGTADCGSQSTDFRLEREGCRLLTASCTIGQRPRARIRWFAQPPTGCFG
jgi:hypothetical protein